jgi:L-alanine-DL-glutamate epimerase-like enolase superfamily enzyme
VTGHDPRVAELTAAVCEVPTDQPEADVTRCGGITERSRATAVAAAPGLQVSWHCGPNLHAQVAAARRRRRRGADPGRTTGMSWYRAARRRLRALPGGD